MPDPAPVALPELDLPPGLQTLAFFSDLHLSAELPRTTAAFEALLDEPEADALFILGDLFEYWVGDEMLDLPYERRCADALRRAAARRPVYVQRGNRDFLLGPRFFAETGCRELAEDPVVLQTAWGARAVLSHGDALCLADRDYQAFRRQVRAPAWQQAFLARPLEERLATARQLRQASRAQARAPETYADADPELAAHWVRQAGAQWLIHGHTHRPGSDVLAGGTARQVLGDWELDHEGPPRGDVLRWRADGWDRCPLSPTSLTD